MGNREMVDISATCKKQLIINYNFFDRAHCRTDRTIAILCVGHKTRVLSCYVHGGKIERMYHRVNLLVHSKCHVDVRK